MEARAAVLLEEGADPQVTDVQIRPPVDDEVLVRVEAVGICHTDVSLAARWPARRLPMVPFIPRLAGLWRAGDLPLEKLVSRFALDDFGKAWTAAKTGQAVKPVVIMPG
jgi:Zn-dependent alcohol dehydrogenase